MVSPTAKAKLPVLATVLFAYQLFFANFRVFLRLVWFPFFVCMAMDFATVAYLTPADGEPRDALGSISSWLLYLQLLIIIPAVTAWHRLVLLGPNNPGSRIKYSLAKSEWKYFLFASLLYIAFVIIWVLIVLFTGIIYFLLGADPDPGPVLLISLITLAPGITILILSRGLLVLPAAAIGENIGIKDSFKLTRGNGIRITLVYILALAPPLLIAPVWNWIGDSDPAETQLNYALLRSFVWLLIEFFFFTITISVLSIAYKYLATSSTPNTAIVTS